MVGYLFLDNHMGNTGHLKPGTGVSQINFWQEAQKSGGLRLL